MSLKRINTSIRKTVNSIYDSSSIGSNESPVEQNMDISGPIMDVSELKIKQKEAAERALAEKNKSSKHLLNRVSTAYLKKLSKGSNRNSSKLGLSRHSSNDELNDSSSTSSSKNDFETALPEMNFSPFNKVKSEENSKPYTPTLISDYNKENDISYQDKELPTSPVALAAEVGKPSTDYFFDDAEPVSLNPAVSMDSLPDAEKDSAEMFFQMTYANEKKLEIKERVALLASEDGTADVVPPRPRRSVTRKTVSVITTENSKFTNEYVSSLLKDMEMVTEDVSEKKDVISPAETDITLTDADENANTSANDVSLSFASDDFVFSPILDLPPALTKEEMNVVLDDPRVSVSTYGKFRTTNSRRVNFTAALSELEKNMTNIYGAILV